MHHLILGTKDEVDHKNHIRLDNRKANLRVVNRSQNNANSIPKRKGYKGVSLDKRRGTYNAYITINYKRIYIGNYKTEAEAAREYDKWATKLFGSFAYLNFPNNGGLACSQSPTATETVTSSTT